MLLRKIDVPQDEINIFKEKIDERGMSEMLAIENYSVQETRREARAEAERQRAEAEFKRKEAELQKKEAERQLEKAKLQLKVAVKLLLDQGNTVTEVAAKMDISEQDIKDLLQEFV